MSTRDNKIGENGLIVFDGACGVCSSIIGRGENFFRRHGFTIAPLQATWVQEVTGLDAETLGRAIHLYTHQGRVYRGLDFVQRLAEEVWWLTPVNVALRIPPIYWTCEKLYGFFAKRRMLISKVCKLSPRLPHE